MITLRDYQERAVNGLRWHIGQGRRSPLLVSPTGSGKTIIFSYMVAGALQKGNRVYTLAHRAELLDQISGSLQKFDVPHAMVSPAFDHDPNEKVQVASVQTIVRRLRKYPTPDLVIVDEAHHAIPGSAWFTCLEHWRAANPRLVTIGVTATPERLSGEGLNDTFDGMMHGPTVIQLIRDGYLSDYRIFGPAQKLNTDGLSLRGGDYARGEAESLMMDKVIVGNALEHYRKYLDGAPTVGFHVSISHAEAMAERYRENGYQAVAISGKTDKNERARIISDFSLGKIGYLATVDLVSEGFDVPGIIGVQLLRPTESTGLYLQQVGRALRKAPGKERAIILDHVGNSHRHGLPCDPREWSLEGKRRAGRRDPDDIQIRQCPNCYAVMRQGAIECDECGAEFPAQAREVAEIDGALEEVKKEEARLKFKKERYHADTMEALVALGKKKGMANPHGWAYHVYNARKRKGQRKLI